MVTAALISISVSSRINKKQLPAFDGMNGGNVAKISKQAQQTILAVGSVGVVALVIYKFGPGLLKAHAATSSGGGYSGGIGGAGAYNPYQNPLQEQQPKPGPSIGFGNPGSIGGGNSRAGAGKPSQASMPNYKGTGSITDFLNSIFEGYDASGNGQFVDEYANSELNGESLSSYSDNLGELSWSDIFIPFENANEQLDVSQFGTSVFGDSGQSASDYSNSYDSYGYDSGGYGSYDSGGSYGYGDYSGYGAGDSGGFSDGYDTGDSSYNDYSY